MAVKRLEPLGVDLGAARLRIAVGERTAAAGIRTLAVASRDLPAPFDRDGRGELEAIVLEDALWELGVSERRCIASIGPPDASLQALRFPGMSYFERRRAARFEILHNHSEESQNKVVRIHPVDRMAHVYAVAVVEAALLRHRVGVIRKAGLRIVAVDYDACALRRIFGEFAAVLDVGHAMTRLHVFAGPVPRSWTTRIGGMHVTEAIARDLDIDMGAAEHRKRILGLAGSHSGALGVCAEALCGLLREAKLSSSPAIRVAMIGNGSRLPGLLEAVSERSGVAIELPVPAFLRASAIADDVLRCASPDWALATALMTWRAA